jgi:arylsulfatase A-like enzyme
VRVELARIPARAEIERSTRAILLNALNDLLNDEDFYQPQYFKKVALSNQAVNIIANKSTGNVSLPEQSLLNRYLLESGFPEIHPLDERYAPRDPRRPDIILISLDTLRADSVSALGYWRDTTPWMRSFFGEKGVLFGAAESPSTWTLPSHAGLFLSQFASRHGVVGANYTLSEGAQTLTEVMAEQGYRTAAFVDGAFLRHRYGFDQGFERYDEISGNFASILPRCEQWLATRDRSEPAFLFLHTYDIHDPYTPPEPFYSRFLTQDLIPSRQEVRAADHFLLRWFNQNEVKPTIDDIEFMKAVYDGGILHVDQMLKNFFAKIESRKLLDNPLVVIVSDHGEAFGEHGYFHHGTAIYEELTHVPVLMRFPDDRHSGTMVESRVSLIDVAPTLLDYLELPVPEDWQGESLLPFIHDPDRERSSGIYSENSQEVAHFNAMTKLIRNRREGMRPDGVVKPPIEVYDLEEDPKEHTNLVHSSPRDFTAEARMMDRALKHMENMRAGEGNDPGSALDPDTIEQLQALGYLQ